MIKLLVQARKNAGVTQADLGSRIGQRQTFISKVEVGERRLDAAEFVEISRAIAADPYVLMREAEARMNDQSPDGETVLAPTEKLKPAKNG